MPVTSKPEKKQQVLASEEAIKAIVNRGGAVPQSELSSMVEEEQRLLKRVQLRLKNEWLKEIDASRKRRSQLSIQSRHNWIMEAIAEKLDREKGNRVYSEGSVL